MKNIFLICSIFTGILFAQTAGAEEAEETSARFGPGKAVEAFSKEDGFKLSAKAISSLGVQFTTLKGNGPWTVPAHSIVHFKQSTAVYRRYDGWLTMVLVKIVKEQVGTTVISSSDLEAGDEVATEGVSFLRLTDADLNSGTVDNCAH